MEENQGRITDIRFTHNEIATVGALLLLLGVPLEIPRIVVNEAKTTDGVILLELKLTGRSVPHPNFWHFLDQYGYRYGNGKIRTLLPCEALEILRKFSEDTRKKLSAKEYFTQGGYILQKLPVTPNCLSIPDISDGIGIMSSDISVSMLKKVIKQGEIIKCSRSGCPNFESHKVEVYDLQSTVGQYLRARGTSKDAHDAKMLFGMSKEAGESATKAWLEKMRTYFMSKGSGYCSSSVITSDAYKRVDEIGLPLEVAKMITFEEKVTQSNMAHLQDLVDQKLCLTYKDGDSTYPSREGSKDHTLLIVGQVGHRRVMDGDVLFISRPPSTHKHSLQPLFVYVHEDHTVKINPLICGPLDADIDGDCVHLFYPQSLVARAEVVGLFSVDQQLLSSHTGKLNLQLKNDSLLSLKMLFKKFSLDIKTTLQLDMFLSTRLLGPALLKDSPVGPQWTVLQILQSRLPDHFDCSGERYLINGSEILKLQYNMDVLQSMLNEIISSVFFEKGSKEALTVFNTLQPLLMEHLFSEGYRVSLYDFSITDSVLVDHLGNIERVSPLLHHLRSTYNELVEMQVGNHLRSVKAPVVNFILKAFCLGNLIDSKSESSINKVLEQIGFLGLQLADREKIYSRNLVDMTFLFHGKYAVNGVECPSEVFGLIKSCFVHGLNPYESLVHSISSREVLVRSSRGLTEPGTLLKNLMAILRDVVICYDGTVRNICINSVIQFKYGIDAVTSSDNFYPAGEPVGVLAATAISNPAYKAVLDSSSSSNTSWDLMKDVLVCKVNFANDHNDRRVISYLKDCSCVKKYCKEIAAYIVHNQMKKVSLRDISFDFLIEYQNQLYESSEWSSSLVGHIHLDKKCLKDLKRSMHDVLVKCQETIGQLRRSKKNKLFEALKNIFLSVSECCCFQQSNDPEWCQIPCLQFSWKLDTSGLSLEIISQIMANLICPILLDTVIKGDRRVSSANIIWLSPDSSTWVENPCTTQPGELALEIVVEKKYVKQHGDAWRITLGSCLPVIHLIDTRRSIPYAIRQVQEVLSCAFDQAVQRLSKSIRMVNKGVQKEHLILAANSMTCTGSLVGFNKSGYRALFRSLNVQIPFTEATLFTPRKCFERAAEKCHTDTLSGIVASSSWGKHVAVGSGTRFKILWNKQEMGTDQNVAIDVYNFLQLVRNPNAGLNTSYPGDDKPSKEPNTNDWARSQKSSEAGTAAGWGSAEPRGLLSKESDTWGKPAESDTIGWASCQKSFEGGTTAGWGSAGPRELPSKEHVDDWSKKTTNSDANGWGGSQHVNKVVGWVATEPQKLPSEEPANVWGVHSSSGGGKPQKTWGKPPRDKESEDTWGKPPQEKESSGWGKSAKKYEHTSSAVWNSLSVKSVGPTTSNSGWGQAEKDDLPMSSAKRRIQGTCVDQQQQYSGPPPLPGPLYSSRTCCLGIFRSNFFGYTTESRGSWRDENGVMVDWVDLYQKHVTFHDFFIAFAGTSGVALLVLSRVKDDVLRLRIQSSYLLAECLCHHLRVYQSEFNQERIENEFFLASTRVLDSTTFAEPFLLVVREDLVITKANVACIGSGDSP
ncbi:DNA-directed RNA polymerase [Ranunculus cassubicifolius]